MTCMASLNEILFYSEPMSKGTKFWILVHFYVYNLIFTTWEFFCMYFSAKWYWWLKGLIPRIQKMHRGQIDLASMYEKKSVEKNESISPKWTQMDWMDSSMQYIIKEPDLKKNTGSQNLTNQLEGFFPFRVEVFKIEFNTSWKRNISSVFTLCVCFVSEYQSYCYVLHPALPNLWKIIIL